MMLKFRSLPLKVILVHLSVASSILFFLSHSSTLSRSSCIFKYDFLIESTFKFFAKTNGSEKVRTSGISFVIMHSSNGPRNDPWGTPFVKSKVLELQLSFLTTFLTFFMYLFENGQHVRQNGCALQEPVLMFGKTEGEVVVESYRDATFKGFANDVH